MLPLTLTYLANPDDPLDAITNGVIFGAMHAAGTFRTPGFNNVKILGGKDYKSPVLGAFEDTANRAAYESLRYYAPKIYPELKPGQAVPSGAHLMETVQQAKDSAIQNVWKRFFFGKTETTSVSDLRGFSRNLNRQTNKVLRHRGRAWSVYKKRRENRRSEKRRNSRL